MNKAVAVRGNAAIRGSNAATKQSPLTVVEDLGALLIGTFVHHNLPFRKRDANADAVLLWSPLAGRADVRLNFPARPLGNAT